MQDKITGLSLLSIQELLTRLDDLEKESARISSQYEPPELEADRENVKREKAEIRAELHQRIKAGNSEILDFAGHNLADTFGPLLQASLPEVPENLQQLSNEELDRLIADVEQRITRFSNFYPNLDRTQSQWVREALDARWCSLQQERETCRPSQLPTRIEASPVRTPLTTEAGAAKRDPTRNVASPINELKEHDLASNSWQEIEIAFLSDERVEICCGATERKTYNYGELELEDHRGGKPNLAWAMLRDIAENNGTLKQPPPGSKRAKVEKRIQEIRAKLRSRFGIQTDPIPLSGGTYRTSFKIGCKPCYHA